jgi:uncharacterized protein (TIGR01777 family)
MRVIVTGGTGLIGRALSASLVGDGHQAIALSRAPERAVDIPAGVRVERWDARTSRGWGALADGADAIVNLAGESIGADRWTPERKRLIRESRLNAGLAVVEAVEQAARKPRVVVQASAVGYYGPRGNEEINEQVPPGDDWMSRTAVEWENSTAVVEGGGVRRAVIRSGVVLSLEGIALPRMLLPFRLFVGGPLGSGRQWLAWIHLADEVRAIRFLIENEEARGAFNLVAPGVLTNAAFGRVIGRVLKRPAVVHVPASALQLLFGEMATVLVDGQRAVPLRLLELGFDFRFPDAEAALRDLLA